MPMGNKNTIPYSDIYGNKLKYVIKPSTECEFYTKIITTTSYLGFLSRCTIAASVLNTVAFMSYKTNNYYLLNTHSVQHTETNRQLTH